MLKLELKRIFSKKINVFAIGLALYLLSFLADLQLQVIAMWMRMEMLVLELWQQENLQITDEHGKVH